MNKKKFTEAVDGSLGLISNIAARLKVNRLTVYRFLDNNPDMRELVMLEKDKIVERAETGLFKRINEGDWNAIRYILNRLGKDKGYTLKNEVSFKGEMENSLSAESFIEAWKEAKQNEQNEE